LPILASAASGSERPGLIESNLKEIMMKTMRWIVALLATAGALTAVGCAEERTAEAPAPAAAETVPDAVQQTWKAFGAPLPSSGQVEKETEHGLETWSIEFRGEAGTTEVAALTDGTLVSVEHEVALADVPASVTEQATRVLGAAPDSVERVRLAVDEFENRTAAGAVRERFVDAYGNVLKTRNVDSSDEQEVEESLEELPAAVRTAIEHESQGATLTELEKETEGGVEMHSAAWKATDGHRELKVLADGTVLSLELPTGTLPARVAALVAGGGAVAGQGSSTTAATAAEDDDREDGAAGETAEHGKVDVERLLLEAWEVEVTEGETVRQALLLPTGELLGDVTAEQRDADEAD
jgi:hypothetical protein